MFFLTLHFQQKSYFHFDFSEIFDRWLNEFECQSLPSNFQLTLNTIMLEHSRSPFVSAPIKEEPMRN